MAALALGGKCGAEQEQVEIHERGLRENTGRGGGGGVKNKLKAGRVSGWVNVLHPHSRHSTACFAAVHEIRTSFAATSSREMFARLFGGGAQEPTSNGASSKEKEGDGSNGSETPQQQHKDELVASHISKMDSIIRCVCFAH